jgi:hypothetical protein
MPCPSYSSCYVHLHNVWWGIQIKKILVVQSSPVPCYLVLLSFLDQNIFLGAWLSDTLSLTVMTHDILQAHPTRSSWWPPGNCIWENAI